MVSIISSSAASKLGSAVFVHPMNFCEARLDDYALMNALGRMEDVSIAVSRLLFSGHLLKFPGVKLVLAMGGGTLPYALGRLARSHDNQKGKVADPLKGFASCISIHASSTRRRSNTSRAKPVAGASCSARTCRFRWAIQRRGG